MSTEIGFLIVAFIITLLYFYLKKKTGSSRNVPPSLPWLLIVGSLPFLSEIGTFHLCLTEKAKQYGNVFSFYAGNSYVVVLNGHEAIREALVKRSKAFAGRNKMFAEQNIYNPDSKGIVFRQYSDYFKMLKNTSMAVMKKFGFGERATMEIKIQKEVIEFIKYIRLMDGKEFDMTQIVRMSTLNIIHSLIFGKRFASGDVTGEYVASEVLAHAESLHPIFDLFPVARFIPKFGKLLNGLGTRAQKYLRMLQDKAEECLNDPDGEENFVSEFVKHHHGSSFDKSEFCFIIRDFLGGGTETSTNLVLWAVLLICNHPSIQERLHREIDSVVPKDRLPSLTDKLPYLEATILEVLRLQVPLPLSVPHMTLSDTEVAGFFVPANTQVIINLSSAHLDPDVWTEPHKFSPERFLNDKNEVINKDRMIAFSFGKRSCPGELLARHEAVLFLGTLIQQFSILPPEGQSRINDRGMVIIVNAPEPFKVRLVARASGVAT